MLYEVITVFIAYLQDGCAFFFTFFAPKYRESSRFRQGKRVSAIGIACAAHKTPRISLHDLEHVPAGFAGPYIVFLVFEGSYNFV